MPEDEFDDNELPWTEKQWEELMRRSDVRSAKFGELLETLRDEPDFEERIAHEMGWARDDEAMPPFEIAGQEEAVDDKEVERVLREEQEALHKLAAYTRSNDWGLKVHDALKDVLNEESGSAPPDVEEDISDAFGCTVSVAAKIAGAHGMGYDDESLCGNIVCCRRALEEGERGVVALESIAAKGLVEKEMIGPFIEEGHQVLALVQEHITELRSRVWWD